MVNKLKKVKTEKLEYKEKQDETLCETVKRIIKLQYIEKIKKQF